MGADRKTSAVNKYLQSWDVLNGSQGATTPMARTTPAMPSLAWRLNDQQVGDVLTYVRNSWGNAASPVASSDVADQRKP